MSIAFVSTMNQKLYDLYGKRFIEEFALYADKNIKLFVIFEGKMPEEMMCASSRMVIRRRGHDEISVVACTLLPYEAEFDYGPSIAAAQKETVLNHPHCARFCVLGGASCSK